MSADRMRFLSRRFLSLLVLVAHWQNCCPWFHRYALASQN